MSINDTEESGRSEELIRSLRENRSYVIRTTRMSPHQKNSLKRLRDRFCLPPIDPGSPGSGYNWETVFPHRAADPLRPVILDIGFGMGGELAELASERRDADFLGIEVHAPGVGKLLSEIERLELENVRIAQQDAVVVCGQGVPPGSVAGVHLFFPDPWPKKRHHKRRLVRPGFPELVAPLLAPGGYLYMVTDWQDYAEQMLGVMEESAVLSNPHGGFAPPQPWRPQTAFERKGLAKGHRIYELLYRCQDSS